jgi:ubiquinone/menaquinone biosynthesis C-methylase UbiE
MDEILAALRAAAEPTRLRLLVLCARAELSVGELTQIVGQSQPRVSRHLKLLCEAGLLDRLREGSSVFYRLARRAEGGALASLLAGLVPDEDPVAALDIERLQQVRSARAAAAAAYFRANAAQWDRIRSLYVEEREVEAALLDLLPPGEVRELLDIGTGTGRMLEIMAPRVEHAVGIDLSREMLAMARVNLERAELKNCTLQRGDMYHLALPGASFDAVVIHQVLHYAEQPEAVLREAARVLRPGGRLILVDFAPHELDFLRTEHAHLRLGFADGEILGWCREAGLEPAGVRHLAGAPLTVGIWTARRRVPRPSVPVRSEAETGTAERAVHVNPTGLV